MVRSKTLTKTIAVSESVHAQLSKLATYKNESFDSIVRRLLGGGEVGEDDDEEEEKKKKI